MFINAMTPFMVGLDTSSTATSFAIYALLKHPELLDRMRAEADDLFAAGDPTEEDLGRMPVTQRVVMETLRVYPIVQALTRTVTNSFDFAGYRIPAGAWVLIANSVTHKLPDFFPDPERFDIERYSPERREHLQPGVYAPFGLGHHAYLERREVPPPPLPPVVVRPACLRRLREVFRGGAPTMSEVWPQMRFLLCWTGASSAAQLPLLEPFLGGIPVLDSPYMCSEAALTVPLYDGADGHPVHPGSTIVELHLPLPACVRRREYLTEILSYVGFDATEGVRAIECDSPPGAATR